MPAGFWRFAVPTAIAGVVSTLVLSRTEVFALNWLGDPAAVGYFALAFGLAAHIFSPAQALVGPLMPAISGLREVDSDAVVAAFRRTVRTSAFLVGALCVSAVPVLALLIPSLYGSGFARSAPMFVALSISAGMLIASGPVSAFVMGRLAARTMLLINVIALVVDAGLAVSLIPALGGWGAVLANMGGAMTLLSLLVRSELRAMVMPWRELFEQVNSLIVALPICVLAWWSAGYAALPVPAEAALGAGLGVLVWVVALRLGHAGITEGDALAFERVVPRRGRPVVIRLLAFVATRSAG